MDFTVKKLSSTDELSMMKVTDLMTAKIISINEDDSILQAMRLFEEERISGIPVKNEFGKYVGVVSKTDLAKVEVRWLLINKGAIDEADFAVKKIMAPMVSIESTASVQDAVNVMTNNRVHRVFVMNEERELIGVISSMDIVKLLSRA